MLKCVQRILFLLKNKNLVKNISITRKTLSLIFHTEYANDILKTVYIDFSSSSQIVLRNLCINMNSINTYDCCKYYSKIFIMYLLLSIKSQLTEFKIRKFWYQKFNAIVQFPERSMANILKNNFDISDY